MISTKAEILALLKRSGGDSVGELASALKLAAGTVRQHLTHLQRDSLIVAEQHPGSAGRPHYVFRLTAKGHAAAFPRRSDRLADLLIREIGFLEGYELIGLTSRQKMSLVLHRLAERLADEYAPLLAGWSLQERITFVTEVMHADGGFAEWERTDRGYEIRDFNCLFHRLFDNGEGKVCEWHQTFLTRTLGTDVRVVPCVDSTARCCRFMIEAVPAAVLQPVLALV